MTHTLVDSSPGVPCGTRAPHSPAPKIQDGADDEAEDPCKQTLISRGLQDWRQEGWCQGWTLAIRLRPQGRMQGVDPRVAHRGPRAPWVPTLQVKVKKTQCSIYLMEFVRFFCMSKRGVWEYCECQHLADPHSRCSLECPNGKIICFRGATAFRSTQQSWQET